MRSSRRELIVGIGAAVAIGVVSALVSASAASLGTVVLETVARAIAVGLPVAVGLGAGRRPPFERFGRLLVATGAGVLAVTLLLSDDAVLYSTGRVVHWGVEAALVYLILAFASGGLTQRVDRALATAAVLLVALLFLPDVQRRDPGLDQLLRTLLQVHVVSGLPPPQRHAREVGHAEIQTAAPPPRPGGQVHR